MGQKEHFWPKMANFLLKMAKKSKTRIFAKNPKRHKSNFYGCPTSCKKTEKNYSAVLAAEPERTHARTHRRTHGSEFIGSFRKLKLPGNQ